MRSQMLVTFSLRFEVFLTEFNKCFSSTWMFNAHALHHKWFIRKFHFVNGRSEWNNHDINITTMTMHVYIFPLNWIALCVFVVRMRAEHPSEFIRIPEKILTESVLLQWKWSPNIATGDRQIQYKKFQSQSKVNKWSSSWTANARLYWCRKI